MKAIPVNLASHPAVWFVIPELGMSYNPRVVLSEVWAVGIEMWAYRLIFPHPKTKEAIRVLAPLPPDFKRCLAQLKLR